MLLMYDAAGPLIVVGRWSLVVSHWLLVVSRWSLVASPNEHTRHCERTYCGAISRLAKQSQQVRQRISFLYNYKTWSPFVRLLRRPFGPPRNDGVFSVSLFLAMTVLLMFVAIFLSFLTPRTLYAANLNFGGRKEIKIQKARKDIRVGERFEYSVYWMGIHIGEGILEVKELVDFNGREAYHIVATARSNDFLSAFYKVEDVIHSYVDKEKLCSLKFEKHQREGRYKADEVVVYDQENHKGYYESLLNKSKKEFEIPEKVQDIVSSFYYFRTLDCKPESRLTLDVNADEKNWKVVMKIGKTEELELIRKGVHEVFCVEPKAPFKGVISKRSRAWVYFSVDEERVPMLIKIRIPFGFVVGVLERRT